MARKVFISYRRDDSRYQARMIYNAFERVLGREGVFMDVDSIPPGANFRKILKEWVDQCEVLLALIGPGWIDATDAMTGQRRLDNPNDFVRIEIAEALARGIPLVPVLLDDVSMPDVGRLPADLHEIVDRQTESIEFLTFDADVARLIRRLGLEPPSAERHVVAGEPTRWEAELAELWNGRQDFWRLLEISYANWSEADPSRSLINVVRSAQMPSDLPLQDNSTFPNWAWKAEERCAGDALYMLKFASVIYIADKPPRVAKSKLLGTTGEFDRFDTLRKELAKFWDKWGRQEPFEQTIREQRADNFLNAFASEIKMLTFLEIARVRWADSDLPGKWGLFRLARRNAEAEATPKN